MTVSEYLCGEIVCPCGEVIRLPYPKGTRSPACVKTWCVECGAILEGMVELVESMDPNLGHPAVGDPKPTYVSIDLIVTKDEVKGAHDDE